MAPRNTQDNSESLGIIIAKTADLIRGFRAVLESPNSHPSRLQDSPNPLALLSDAAKVLKAQSTKLSLLILNKPYTPSAISNILNSLCNECLPALMSGLELCSASKYTALLHRHNKNLVSGIWAEFLHLVSSIPLSEQAAEAVVGQNTLTSTGRLWEQCDEIIELGSNDLNSLAAKYVGSQLALLEDAIKELDEWNPDEELDESSEDSEAEDVKEIIITPNTSDEESLHSSMQNLHVNPLLALKSRTLKHLRMIRMLYPALQKRRISTFPTVNNETLENSLPSSEQVQRFDMMISHTKNFTEETDEIAGAFYSDIAPEVERRLSILLVECRKCVKNMRIDWHGEDDAFTGWVDKWLSRLEEVGKG